MKRFHLTKSLVALSLTSLLYTAAYAEDISKQQAFNALNTSAISKLQASKIDVNALLSNPSNDLMVNFDETSFEVNNSDNTGKSVATRRFKAVKQNVNTALTDSIILRDYYGSPTSFYRVSSLNDLVSLLNNPNVTSITADRTMTASDYSALDLIDQPEASQEYIRTNYGGSHYFRGKGSVIAVLDSGIDYTHRDFGYCNYRLNSSNCSVIDVLDFAYESNGRFDTKLDDAPNRHGSNVSAIALSVAPEAKLLGMDVFQWQYNRNTGRSNFVVHTYAINAALNWLYNNHISNNRNGLNVVSVNMSLGFSTQERYPTNEIPLIGRLKSLGAATLIATGNEYQTDSISWPASESEAISVGAVHDNRSYRSEQCGNYGYISGHNPDDVTCFSNSGRLLDLLAPGYEVSGAGITISGTSMATPHVAGAYAVMRSPEVLKLTRDSVDDTTRRIERSGKEVRDFRNGITRPRIDLLKAVQTVNN